MADKKLKLDGTDMTFSEELSRASRTVMVRGYCFSRSEMVRYRIMGVYNASGSLLDMDQGYINSFAHRVCNFDRGQMCIIETAIRTKADPGKVVSVIVFSDQASYQMYLIKEYAMYKKLGHRFETIMN